MCPKFLSYQPWMNHPYVTIYKSKGKFRAQGTPQQLDFYAVPSWLFSYESVKPSRKWLLVENSQSQSSRSPCHCALNNVRDYIIIIKHQEDKITACGLSIWQEENEAVPPIDKMGKHSITYLLQCPFLTMDQVWHFQTYFFATQFFSISCFASLEKYTFSKFSPLCSPIYHEHGVHFFSTYGFHWPDDLSE